MNRLIQSKRDGREGFIGCVASLEAGIAWVEAIRLRPALDKPTYPVG